MPPTSTVRVNVINLTTQPAPFIFRFGGIQFLDTIAPPGSLPVPVITHNITIVPGKYGFQLFDRQTRRIVQDSLDRGDPRGNDFATIELIFDGDGWSVSKCHCSRVYGRTVSIARWVR